MTADNKTQQKTDFKLKQNDNKITLTKTLKQEYPHIIQSMKQEKYKIEYEEYNLLQEFLYENKIIGFMTIETIQQITPTLCINEVYILPEYRHKGIFFETLIYLLNQPNLTIALRNPNRQMIDNLQKYNLAKKLENNLLLSYIDFLVDESKNYTNKQIITEYDTNTKNNSTIPTDFYDLNINSCVYLEIINLNDIKNNKVYITKARLTDTRNEKYYNLLKNVDNIYLENLKERIFTINDKEIEFLQTTQKNLEEYININDLLGTEDQLTPMFIEQLEENKLTIEDGFKIRSKVIKSLEKNEIIPKSIIIRTLYLLEHYKHNEYNIDNNIPINPTIEEKCPYCHNINKKTQEVCSKCGYNLQLIDSDYDTFLEMLTDKIFINTLEPELQLKEELNNKQSKITSILRGELDYMQYDEKEVYNIQNIISTYQLLKDINEIIYFEIYNYDLLNNIRDGSAFQYAKNNNLLEELKNYKYYVKLMEDYYPDNYLKRILRENNYETIGEKDELLKVIETNINPREIFGSKYVLTRKGEDFLIDKDYVENYLENLSEFTFYEYKRFYDDNKDKSFDEINSEFVKLMKEIAIKTNNYYKYHDTIRHMINSSNMSSREFLVLFTLLFIIDINYWIYSKEHRKNNKPLSKNIVAEYPVIKRLFFQYDLDEIFCEAMDRIELDFLKSNEALVKFYLEKSLEYIDIDDINREIEYIIFTDEYLKRYTI